MPTTYSSRRKIAQDTLERTESVVQLVPGASLDSTFIAAQLSALPPLSTHATPCKVEVVNGDAFTAARQIIHDDGAAQGKTAVLNLASDELRAGGWIESLATTQVRLKICNVLAEGPAFVRIQVEEKEQQCESHSAGRSEIAA